MSFHVAGHVCRGRALCVYSRSTLNTLVESINPGHSGIMYCFPLHSVHMMRNAKIEASPTLSKTEFEKTGSLTATWKVCLGAFGDADISPGCGFWLILLHA